MTLTHIQRRRALAMLIAGRAWALHVAAGYHRKGLHNQARQWEHHAVVLSGSLRRLRA